jgi:hypothetical protein
MSGGITVDAFDDDDGVLISPIPGDKLVHFSEHLLNSSSKDMAVDGSTVNVEFSSGPGTGVIWYINEIGLSIDDNGNNTPSTFGAISGLTNGVLIEQQISSTDYEFDNLVTNLDIIAGFTDHFLRGQSNAYLNSANFFSGKVELRQAITLVGDDSDIIKALVRDDLTGLNILEMTIEGFMVV